MSWGQDAGWKIYDLKIGDKKYNLWVSAFKNSLPPIKTQWGDANNCLLCAVAEDNCNDCVCLKFLLEGYSDRMKYTSWIQKSSYAVPCLVLYSLYQNFKTFKKFKEHLEQEDNKMPGADRVIQDIQEWYLHFFEPIKIKKKQK